MAWTKTPPYSACGEEERSGRRIGERLCGAQSDGRRFLCQLLRGLWRDAQQRLTLGLIPNKKAGCALVFVQGDLQTIVPPPPPPPLPALPILPPSICTVHRPAAEWGVPVEG